MVGDDKGLHMNDKKIDNLQAGLVSKDSKEAINGSQLYEVKSMVQHVENHTTQLQQNLHALEQDSRQGDAMNAALSALKPIAYSEEKPSQIMAGIGNYKDKTAFALGLGHYANKNTFAHAGLAYAGSGSTAIVNAGISVRFGHSDAKETKANAMASTDNTALANTVNAMMEQLKLQEQRMKQLESENDNLKQKVMAMESTMKH